MKNPFSAIRRATARWKAPIVITVPDPIEHSEDRHELDRIDGIQYGLPPGDTLIPVGPIRRVDPADPQSYVVMAHARPAEDIKRELADDRHFPSIGDQIARQRVDYAMRTGILPGLHCGGEEIEPPRLIRPMFGRSVWWRNGDYFAVVHPNWWKRRGTRLRWNHTLARWFIVEVP